RELASKIEPREEPEDLADGYAVARAQPGGERRLFGGVPWTEECACADAVEPRGRDDEDPVRHARGVRRRRGAAPSATAAPNAAGARVRVGGAALQCDPL